MRVNNSVALCSSSQKRCFRVGFGNALVQRIFQVLRSLTGEDSSKIQTFRDTEKHLQDIQADLLDIARNVGDGFSSTTRSIANTKKPQVDLTSITRGHLDVRPAINPPEFIFRGGS